MNKPVFLLCSCLLVSCTAFSRSHEGQTTYSSSSSEKAFLTSGNNRNTMHEEYLIPAKPTIPNGWTYVELTNTPFEIPLPPKYSMKDLSQDDTLMTEVQSDSPVSLWESSQFIFDIWTGKEHQFFSNLDQFFRSICNPDFPEGNGDYRLYYSTVVNGINVMKFYPSCIGQDLKPDAEVMNIEIMLLVYQNKFYQVELSDQKFTDLKGEQLLETSMLNIRPRKVPNVSQ